MLKNLHLYSLFCLLSLFDSILRQGIYPLAYKLAIILPIVISIKDPTFLSPSGSTCILSKLSQKILNKILFSWFFESNNILSTF